jgi:hypothetical protein
MEQQEAVRIELYQDIFPAAAERANPGTVEPGRERWRKRPPKIGATQLCAYDPSPADSQRQTPPDGLDFGQFGHCSVDKSARGSRAVARTIP